MIALLSCNSTWLARRVLRGLSFFSVDGGVGLGAEELEVGVGGAEFGQFLLGVEIMDRFVVAIAHLDEVAGQLAGLGMAVLDVIAEIAAVAAEGLNVFVEGRKQVEDFGQLLFGKLLVGGQVVEAHVLAAQLDEDLVELGVAIHVFDAFFAGDLVKGRLGNIDKAALDQLGHLPVKEGQQ